MWMYKYQEQKKARKYNKQHFIVYNKNDWMLIVKQTRLQVTVMISSIKPTCIRKK